MKIKSKKAKVLALAVLILSLVPAITVNAGFLKQKSGKYRYYTSTQNYKKGICVKGKFINIKKNGKTFTYYLDPKTGDMARGWKKIKVGGRQSWYYFDSNGRMIKNRTKNGHYLGKDGRMVTDKMVNGVYYGSDGSAIPDYKQAGAFVKTKKGIKYRQPDGTYAAKTWKCIKDGAGYHWYYFYSSGYMAKDKWLGDKYVNRDGQWEPNRVR